MTATHPSCTLWFSCTLAGTQNTRIGPQLPWLLSTIRHVHVKSIVNFIMKRACIIPRVHIQEYICTLDKTVHYRTHTVHKAISRLTLAMQLATTTCRKYYAQADDSRQQKQQQLLQVKQCMSRRQPIGMVL